MCWCYILLGYVPQLTPTDPCQVTSLISWETPSILEWAIPWPMGVSILATPLIDRKTLYLVHGTRLCDISDFTLTIHDYSADEVSFASTSWAWPMSKACWKVRSFSANSHLCSTVSYSHRPVNPTAYLSLCLQSCSVPTDVSEDGNKLRNGVSICDLQWKWKYCTISESCRLLCAFTSWTS